MTILLLIFYFVLSWVVIVPFDLVLPTRIHLFLPLTKLVRVAMYISKGGK